MVEELGDTQLTEITLDIMEETHLQGSLSDSLERDTRGNMDTAQEGAMEGDGREEGDGKCPATDMAEAIGDQH